MHLSESFFNGQSYLPAISADRVELDAPYSATSDVPQGFLHLVSQMPHSVEAEQIQTWVRQLEWFQDFQHFSRLLIAVVEPGDMTLRYANDYFYRLTGLAPSQCSPEQPGAFSAALEQLLSEADFLAIQQLYRRHVLHLVFRDLYGRHLLDDRALDEPVLLSLHSPLYPEPRFIQLWLRSQQLRVRRIDLHLDEFADLDLHTNKPEDIWAKLTRPAQLQVLENQLQMQNYQVEGHVLLEGVDVTVQETIRRITQSLIDWNSILQPQKFQQIDEQMRSLFRNQDTVIVTIESDQIRLFMGSVSQELETTTYSLDSMQNSPFMAAIQTNRVVTVANLALEHQTECGRQLADLGVRSLLLIPLISHGLVDMAHGLEVAAHQQPIGLVGLLSDRSNHFDQQDCRYAEKLIPAFTVALSSAQRQLIQQRFVKNIHPAVEWRFLQEIERRSLGLPPEPIIFTDVYPLYGISDIRGSSEERNSAIQADLLEQCQLALMVIDAARSYRDSALCEQLRLDLLEHIQQLERGVTVDAEVSGIRYLRDSIEAYFDYFNQCGAETIAAIDAYRNACTNDHGCIYQSRARYDQTIGQINTLLRETWDRWQKRMQQITPHYCDVEVTDGTDHMIYAGRSIDPSFGNFQLRSLRYEQLRAMCDCARTAFRLQQECDTAMQVTHLVLVQDATVDIFHDETTERLFDVQGTRDTRYAIVKKRIDKALDEQNQSRITQPGMLTLVYSSEEEWLEYQQYLCYLMREGWVDTPIERGKVQPLQGVTGLKYARVRVLPADS
jgi:hypothetical protein